MLFGRVGNIISLNILIVIYALGSAKPDSTIILGVPGRPSLSANATKQSVADRNSLQFEFNCPGIEAVKVETEVGSFTRFSSSCFGVAAGDNSLELPVFRKILKFEQGRKIYCSFAIKETQDFDLMAEGLPGRIMCLQPSIPKVPGAVEAQETVYKIDTSNAENPLVCFSRIGTSAGLDIWLLEVCPVSYANGSVTLFSGISVVLSATDAMPLAVLNTETKSGERLLIVAPNEFYSLLDVFAAHKESFGMTVDIVLTNETGSSAAEIQSFVSSRYADNSTSPSHLLLVGDTDSIPSWQGDGSYTPDTDLYYACMDGPADWMPDMAYGRLPARNILQLSNMLERIINYEVNVTTDSPFVSNAVFAASSDNYSVTEGTHNSVINTHMDPRLYVSDKAYAYTYGAVGQDVINQINLGSAIVAYSGHAYYNKWRNPGIDISDIYSLSNDWRSPVVLSFSCDSGSYADYNECLAEAWLRVPSELGGVAVFASSQASYWGEDDILQRCVFSSIYEDGRRMLGDVIVQAKERYLAYYGTGSETLQYFEQYNLFGDPTVRMHVLDGASVTDGIAAERSFTQEYVQSNDVITVTVDLQIPPAVPSSLILKEILPAGWTVLNAQWNGVDMSPSYQNGEYKWLFGFGTPVSSGTLVYQTRAEGVPGSTCALTGQLLYEDNTLQTLGDQQIRISTVVDFNPYHDGDGTAENPYHISTKDEFLYLVDTPDDYDQHFLLVADIDLTGEPFARAVIAPNTLSGTTYSGSPFSGVFDGNGNVIRNVAISISDSNESFIGLFGKLNGAEIKNLGVENITITDSSNTSRYIGGLVGQNSGSVISKCYVDTVALQGGFYMGGFCGLNSYSGSISDCYAIGVLNGSGYVGGFCGYNYQSGSIGNSYAVCTISSTGITGGFCAGADATGTATACFWDITVSGMTASSGGTGKTTTEMEAQSTFTGWDFVDTWNMDEYPVLSVFGALTFTEWLDAEAVPADQRGENDTPMNDGIPNLLKFACGMPAMTVATRNLMDISNDVPGEFAVLYLKSKHTFGVTLEPVWAADLSGLWQTAGMTLELLDENEDVEQWKASVSIGDSGFIKLRASQE